MKIFLKFHLPHPDFFASCNRKRTNFFSPMPFRQLKQKCHWHYYHLRRVQTDRNEKWKRQFGCITQTVQSGSLFHFCRFKHAFIFFCILPKSSLLLCYAYRLRFLAGLYLSYFHWENHRTRSNIIHSPVIVWYALCLNTEHSNALRYTLKCRKTVSVSKFRQLLNIRYGVRRFCRESHSLIFSSPWHSTGARESEAPQIQLWGPYNEGLEAEPPAESRAEPLVKGQGAKPPWSWAPCLIDSIITLMTVWRITGKIIRTTFILNYICTRLMEFLQF